MIGNQLWYETGSSINGLYEPGRGDIGIEGVTMELLGANDALLATQVTGPSGDYAFTSLAAGTYKVRVGSSVTYPANGAILAGYKPTVPGPTQGADNNHQVPQPYTIVLAANGINITADFGYTDIPPAAIGDLVWYDTDQDGFQDVGEPGIANVKVELYRDNGRRQSSTCERHVGGDGDDGCGRRVHLHRAGAGHILRGRGGCRHRRAVTG